MTIVVGAIGVRLILALWLGTWHAPESFESESLVRNLLAGQGYSHEFLGTVYRSFHSILPYDGLTTLVYWLTGGSQTVMLCVQWCLAGCLAVLVGRLGSRIGGAGIGSLAAWIVALHPGLVAYDATKLQQVSFDAGLVALAVLVLIRWSERPSWRRAAWAGLVAGLLMYERGTIALFFPAAILWVKQAGRLPWGTWGRQVSLSVGVAGLVVLPWLVRNVIVHQRVVPMMTTTWLALWKGNHQGATGTEYTSDDRPILQGITPALRERVAQADELGQMDAFREASLRFIREQPWTVVQLVGRKLRFFWWRSPHTGLGYPGAWSWTYHAWYLAMAVCAIYGAVHLGLRGGSPWMVGQLLGWLAGLFSLGQSLFYVAGRHRWTIEPVLAVLSAYGIWRLYEKIQGKLAVTGAVTHEI